MALLERVVYGCMPQHSNVGCDVSPCLALGCVQPSVCVTDGDANEFCDIIYFLVQRSKFSMKLGVSFRNIVLTVIYKWQDYGALC